MQAIESLTPPRRFLETIVRPNIEEFHSQYDDLRRAYNAVASLDALVAHIFWHVKSTPSTHNLPKDDSAYREILAKHNEDFGLLRDIAKAQKHILLDRGEPRLTRADQVSSRRMPYGGDRFGEGPYGGTGQVIVTTNDGKFSSVRTVVKEALAFLECEMRAHAI